jgi:hypothetical protein
MADPPTRAKFLGVLALVAVSTPLALAFETALRQIMFPPELEEVRMWLRPMITPWVWSAPLLCAVAVPLGAKLQAWLVARDLAARPPEQRTPERRAAAELDAMLLSTSAPQLPAVLSTVAFMAGSHLLPVVAAMVVATAGILVLGLATLRRVAPPRSE